MKSVRSLPIYLSGVLLIGILCSMAGATPLDTYVNAPDPAYNATLVGAVPGTGFTAYIIDLTSQQWRSSGEVDQTIWKHWLVVVVPDGAVHNTGMVVIGGGSNSVSPPTSVGPEVLQFALDTNSVVAELSYIPNQPLTFATGGQRWEDDLIAYTWDKHLQGGDDQWPARMPMTKAVVMAMDAIQEHDVTMGQTINNFVVAGASKRGWTTWTTAAVDSRVVALVPIVIDVLNVVPSFQHHYAAYGYYADAVDDYVDQGIMNWIGGPEFDDLMDIVDPYAYLSRYATKPKMIVNSTGDQFFLPDSSQYYFDDLPGEKYLRYVPNTDHGLNPGAVNDVSAFYSSILNDTPRPEFTWESVREGKLKVMPTTIPSEVLLWQATNPVERNFRLDSLGAAWTSTPLTANDQGEYIALVDPPTTGWTGYFVELTYPTGGPHPMKYTTSVYMTTQRYKTITIDGNFSDWSTVGSNYDRAGDTHDTDQDQANAYPAPINHPDVDLIECKFAHDDENLYAYFKATGEIGRTQTEAAGKAGRYYAIVTIDVDNDDSTGYPLHEGGYYPTTPGYDMNMEVEFYGGAFNTGHYLNHGCLSAAFRDNVAWEDQKLGLLDVRPGTYDFYTQWVWWDTEPNPRPADLVDLPAGEGYIVPVLDKGPVYQGIIEIALSGDKHEAEMVAPFRGFMRDKNNPDKQIMALGKTIDISISLEGSGELAPDLEWASDTAHPINGYYLSCEFPHDDDDGDELENGEELDYGTDLDNPDTDGDTFSDGDEVRAGTDPLDPLSNPQMEITFPDPGLDAAVRDAIGIPTGQLYNTDVIGTGFTTLDASGRSISDLSGLQYCRELTNLNLSNNDLAVITQLSVLSALTQLNLSDNLLEEVLPLLDNFGLGLGDAVQLNGNPLTGLCLCETLPVLEARFVTLSFDGGCVVDDVPPVITVLDDAEIFLNLGDLYVDPGATALDDIDGDITGLIVTYNPVDTSFVGTFQVTYQVMDAFLNPAVPGIRTVHVADPIPPVLTLLGDAELTVDYDSVYVDEGVSVSDNYDTNLAASVVVDNPVDTSITDDYTVTYTVSDASGNPAVPVTRLVHVDEASTEGEGEGEGEEIPEETLAQDLLDVFDDADTDKDNKLSYLEARDAMPELSYERFQDLDKNSDGYLSEKELKDIINPPAECGCGTVKSFTSFKDWVQEGLSDLLVFGLLLFSFNAWGGTRRRKKK